MKLIRKQNPIQFIDNHFHNLESVPMNEFFIIYSPTGEIFDRDVASASIEATGVFLPSLDANLLKFDNGTIREKTADEIDAELVEAVNKSFHYKKYEVRIKDFRAFNDTGFNRFAMYLKEHPNVITVTEPTNNGDPVVSKAYLNFIEPADMDTITGATAVYEDGTPIFEVSINPNYVG